jgi:hypothetical protein
VVLGRSRRDKHLKQRQWEEIVNKTVAGMLGVNSDKLERFAKVRSIDDILSDDKYHIRGVAPEWDADLHFDPTLRMESLHLDGEFTLSVPEFTLSVPECTLSVPEFTRPCA